MLVEMLENYAYEMEKFGVKFHRNYGPTDQGGEQREQQHAQVENKQDRMQEQHLHARLHQWRVLVAQLAEVLELQAEKCMHAFILPNSSYLPQHFRTLLILHRVASEPLRACIFRVLRLFDQLSRVDQAVSGCAASDQLAQCARVQRACTHQADP